MNIEIYEVSPMPGHLVDVLGSISNLVHFFELNKLISAMETNPDSKPNYPIIFKSTAEGSAMCKAGFDKWGNVVFYVGKKKVFSCDYKYWNYIGLRGFQELVFRRTPDEGRSEHYQLLPGTYSGKKL